MHSTARRNAVLALNVLLALFVSWMLFAFVTRRTASAKLGVTVFSIGLILVVVLYSALIFSGYLRRKRYVDWVSAGLIYLGISGVLLGVELQLLSTLWGWRERTIAVWGPGVLLCGLAVAAGGGVLGFADAVYRAIRLRLMKGEPVPAVFIGVIGLLVLIVAGFLERALLVKVFGISAQN